MHLAILDDCHSPRCIARVSTTGQASLCSGQHIGQTWRICADVCIPVWPGQSQVWEISMWCVWKRSWQWLVYNGNLVVCFDLMRTRFVLECPCVHMGTSLYNILTICVVSDGGSWLTHTFYLFQTFYMKCANSANSMVLKRLKMKNEVKACIQLWLANSLWKNKIHETVLKHWFSWGHHLDKFPKLFCCGLIFSSPFFLLLQLDDQDCAATQRGNGLRSLFPGRSFQRHPPISAPLLASSAKHPHWQPGLWQAPSSFLNQKRREKIYVCALLEEKNVFTWRNWNVLNQSHPVIW